jgi:hypothetical protein
MFLSLCISLNVIGGESRSSGIGLISDPIVFVSRQIPPGGSIYWSVPNDLPGVGPHSRFRVAAPGKLVVRESNGTLRVLIDGSTPAAASKFLIDVNAPSVSYDATKIVFAGIPQGSYPQGPVTNPGAWRIYTINADGTGLTQVTFSDQSLNLTQFGGAAGGLGAYDDTDPAWLPDGRIVLSSTRWPSFGHYSGVRTSNVYVVNANGTNLRRITAERNGADRPLVDPVTGKIVYARWWRNHRFALNDTSTVASPQGGYLRHNGLSAERGVQIDGSGQYGDWLWRNAWQAAAINPDGTGLSMWGGIMRNEEVNHVYGGAFSSSGELFANYFPMYNMTEAGGFGGIRHYKRGPARYTPVTGVTTLTLDYVHTTAPTSYGIFNGSYATDPDELSDGSFVVSRAVDVAQDYGLYTMNADGSGLQLLYDNPGTTEIRARALRVRPVPPVLADAVSEVPSLLPPTAAGPYDGDGTFVFDALNVYFNAPVDTDIVSAPAIGSAQSIRFFIDHQRTSPGSFPNLDWPVQLGEKIVGPDGAVKETSAPANVPLFEQLRSSHGTVPLTGGPNPDGAAHVTGMNFGRPGTTARCVGCHAGHTMIPVPANDADALWSNLAPGAAVVVSSTRDANTNRGLIDRRVRKGEIWRYWTSGSGQSQNQWVKLTFPAPVFVRTVRLYNPRAGDEANSSLRVLGTTVRLYSDDVGITQTASGTTGELSVSGTDVSFPDVFTRSLKVEITGMTGTFYGMSVASIAEIEVIAKGAGTPTDADVVGLPATFDLAQNYPNPFNPISVIRYSLPVDGYVSLKIFDILGREVTRIVDKQQQAGNFEVTVDAGGLASGMYFYTLTCGNFSAVRKMIIMK